MPNNLGMESLSPIGKAVNIVGGITSLARIVGVSPPTVHEWKAFKRPVPITRCSAIEAATNGAVTRQELRPTDWHEIWPELAQTPANTAQAATENVAGQGA